MVTFEAEATVFTLIVYRSYTISITIIFAFVKFYNKKPLRLLHLRGRLN